MLSSHQHPGRLGEAIVIIRSLGTVVERKINVLQVVDGLGAGGAEKKLFELVKHMDTSRFHTTFCSLGLVEEICSDFYDLDVESTILPRRSWWDWGHVFRLAGLMKRQEIDIVMTTLFYADVLGALAGRMAGVKAVFSWETISSPDWLVPRRLLLYRFATRYTKKIVAVSQATARFLKEERGVPEDRILVIPYGVDLDKYRTQRSEKIRTELGFRPKNTVVGVVARLEPQKGHVYLIRAARKIIDAYPSVRFAFIGKGGLRDELEQMIREAGLDDHFMFLGFREGIPRILRAVDIFTLPSLFEGLPNVILEAMAAGKPVVASSVDGSVEAVVDEETGLLFPPKDSEALADALVRLLKHPKAAQEMGMKGRKRVEDHFALKRQVAEFETLYMSGMNAQDGSTVFAAR